jgi:hypothetical protein
LFKQSMMSSGKETVNDYYSWLKIHLSGSGGGGAG